MTISDSVHDTEESRLNGDGTSAPKVVDWHFIINGGPSTKYMCDDCGFMTASVCAADGDGIPLAFKIHSGNTNEQQILNL